MPKTKTVQATVTQPLSFPNDHTTVPDWVGRACVKLDKLTLSKTRQADHFTVPRSDLVKRLRKKPDPETQAIEAAAWINANLSWIINVTILASEIRITG